MHSLRSEIGQLRALLISLASLQPATAPEAAADASPAQAGASPLRPAGQPASAGSPAGRAASSRAASIAASPSGSPARPASGAMGSLLQHVATGTEPRPSLLELSNEVGDVYANLMARGGQVPSTMSHQDKGRAKLLLQWCNAHSP